jgi:DNA-binding CsgD family transcriptional regulator
MPAGEDLLTTIEAIHAAGMDAALWPDALKRVSRLFGAVGATLENFDMRALTLRDFYIVGLPHGAADPYLEYYAKHNPRANYAFRHLSQQTLCDYDFMDERGMDRDPYYTEYLTSIGLRYFLTGQISNTPDSQAVVSIQRSRRQGHVEGSDVERMRRLIPHLRQAWDVMTRLKRADRNERNFERALDWLADGVALLRADGRILYANESFRGIARRSGAFRINKGGIEFAAASARARFATAHALAMRVNDAGLGTCDFAVARRGGGTPYMVSLRPIAPRRDGPSRPPPGAATIMFVHDPQQHHIGSIEILRDAFGLTEAEAGVAKALQDGVALGDYARERMLSLNTIYTHLRRIKEKTACHRMPELIRKLNDLHVPLRLD